LESGSFIYSRFSKSFTIYFSAETQYKILQMKLKRLPGVSLGKPKIQYIRDEFERIGCKGNWQKPFSVFWSFHDITVMGQKCRTLAFEALQILLKQLPDDVGEKAFWDLLDNTDINALYDEVNRLIEIENMRLISTPRKSKDKKKTAKTRPKKTPSVKRA
jgi:hypothetical protein